MRSSAEAYARSLVMANTRIELLPGVPTTVELVL